MKRNWILIIVLVSVALNVAFVGGYFHSGRQAALAARPGAATLMAARLGLNAEQEAVFRSIHADARRALSAHLAEEIPTVNGYWQMMTQTGDDLDAIDKLIVNSANRRADLNLRLTRLLRTFMSGLSHDQRREFATLLRNRTVFGGRFLMSGLPQPTNSPKQTELTQ